MKKSLLLLSLAVASTSVFGMCSRDVDRRSRARFNLQKISNQSFEETSKLSKKRLKKKIDPTDSKRQPKKRETFNNPDTAISIRKEPIFERERSVDSHVESKLRLITAILEYPEKNLYKDAKDNGISVPALYRTIKKLPEETLMQLKDDPEKTWGKTRDLVRCYYDGGDFDDFYEIFDKNKGRTKKIFAELMYAVLSEEEEKQWITNYTGLLEDIRKGVITQKRRMEKHKVRECEDFLTRYIAKKRRINLSPKEVWWHVEYKNKRTVPLKIRKQMIDTFNEGVLTKKGVAEKYKTSLIAANSVLVHADHPIHKKIKKENFSKIVTDLIAKPKEEVRKKYKCTDGNLKRYLMLINQWRQLSNDQKNIFKKVLESKNISSVYDLSNVKKSQNLWANFHFEKLMNVMPSADEEIKPAELRLRKKIWNILAMGEINLIKAAKNGNEKTIKNLIEKGSDINCVDEYGQTPLMWAVAIGNENIVKYLLERGADVNYKDQNDDTALQVADDFGLDEIINILKRHGAV